MNLQELKSRVDIIISNLKDKGVFPKENNLIDYKSEIKISPSTSHTENFLMNFAKDIISFANADGGIILLGIKEDKINGKHEDIGLNPDNLNLLNLIDLNDVSQRFDSITKAGVSIDLQLFQITTRKYYYLIIEKSNSILIPINDFNTYNLKKGAIIYRKSGKNEHANKSTQFFNDFLQIKANEKSKEFMEIWSKLLPEMVDINPREVLILNPNQNKIYGFNSKENILSSGEIDIDKSDDGVFKVILNAITAGEVGKITDTEGKPLFKIMGELHDIKERISLTSLEKEVKKQTKYKFTNLQLKAAIHHLDWVNSTDFPVINPPEGTVNIKYKEFLWVGTLDSVAERKKILFSSKSIPVLTKVIDDKTLHQQLFNKNLDLNQSSRNNK